VPPAGAEKLIVPLLQTTGIGVNATGIAGTTTTPMVFVVIQGPEPVDKLYTPELPIELIVGFCKLEVKPPGPVQVYVVAVPVDVKLNVFPAHIGLLELNVELVTGTTVVVIVVVVKHNDAPVVSV
jgi:hypothetical protein